MGRVPVTYSAYGKHLSRPHNHPLIVLSSVSRVCQTWVKKRVKIESSALSSSEINKQRFERATWKQRLLVNV